MNLTLSIPALLFPAVSLLFLSYTNRFLFVAGVIRKLHEQWQVNSDALLASQIKNLKGRIVVIRRMQHYGAYCLLLAVVSMICILFELHFFSWLVFCFALILMAVSLVYLCREIFNSGSALNIILDEMDKNTK